MLACSKRLQYQHTIIYIFDYTPPFSLKDNQVCSMFRINSHDFVFCSFQFEHQDDAEMWSQATCLEKAYGQTLFGGMLVQCLSYFILATPYQWCATGMASLAWQNNAGIVLFSNTSSIHGNTDLAFYLWIGGLTSACHHQNINIVIGVTSVIAVLLEHHHCNLCVMSKEPVTASSDITLTNYCCQGEQSRGQEPVANQWLILTGDSPCQLLGIINTTTGCNCGFFPPKTLYTCIYTCAHTNATRSPPPIGMTVALAAKEQKHRTTRSPGTGVQVLSSPPLTGMHAHTQNVHTPPRNIFLSIARVERRQPCETKPFHGKGSNLWNDSQQLEGALMLS